VPQERWRLILLGSRYSEIAPPEPTHYATGRANFRSGGVLTFRLTDSDRRRLLPAITVGEAIGDLPSLKMGEGAETIGYTTDKASCYAQAMRNPEGITYNHFAAKLSKQNSERMKYVKPGGSWRDIPHHLLPKGMQRAQVGPYKTLWPAAQQWPSRDRHDEMRSALGRGIPARPGPLLYPCARPRASSPSQTHTGSLAPASRSMNRSVTLSRY
jgi:hypothetical protein